MSNFQCGGCQSTTIPTYKCICFPTLYCSEQCLVANHPYGHPIQIMRVGTEIIARNLMLDQIVQIFYGNLNLDYLNIGSLHRDLIPYVDQYVIILGQILSATNEEVDQYLNLTQHIAENIIRRCYNSHFQINLEVELQKFHRINESILEYLESV